LNNPDTLPDYYAILQVHPSAEQDVIKAAYRRLMHKYHPDTLSPELRSDPEILTRVRSIILAYDVLSDPAQRAAYDAALKQQKTPADPPINPNLEIRVIMGRCGRTKQRFRILLGRRRGRDRFFQVLGFELVDVPQPQLKGSPEIFMLPAPAQPTNLIKRLIRRPGGKKNAPPMPNPKPFRFPSNADINEILAENSELNLAEINFAGKRCPVCNQVHEFSDGSSTGWVRCNSCKRIYCASAIGSTKLGDFTHCPWCGRTGRLGKNRISLGDDVNMPVRGEVDHSLRHRDHKQNPKLEDGKPKSLPEK
jgi:curved DNA-binding protein CbpA